MYTYQGWAHTYTYVYVCHSSATYNKRKVASL